MLLNILILISGITLLIKGADFFIAGASDLAHKFKIPQIVIGLTIVAMGTSAPEAGVTINSALKGITGIAIGNIFGSNIANILLILGLTSAICTLKIQKNTVKYEIPFVIFISTLVCFAGYYLKTLNRLCGVVMLLLFVLFLGYLYRTAKSNSIKNEENTKHKNIFLLIVLIMAGLGALVWGSDLTVNSAVNIAHLLNISNRIIGLTIIAIGTSLPELVTCIISALKKQPDLAIGNIVGSNIFNILFNLGVTCTIKPITFNPSFLIDGIIMILSAVLLLAFTYNDKKLSCYEGLLFVSFYIIYLGYLFFK